MINKEHLKSGVTLALPVVATQAGQMAVALVDTAMVGHLGTTELAAAAFANGVFWVFFVLGIGVTFGITPLVGTAIGAGRREDIANLFKQGIGASLIIGVVLTIGMYFTSFLFPYMGQQPEVIEMATPFYLLLVVSVLPNMLFFGFKQFTEGIYNTRIAMIITLICNVVNIFFNWVLIYGYWGFPEMGLMGSGWATLIARMMMPLLFLFFVYRMPLFKEYRNALIHIQFHWKTIKEIFAIGLPVGGQFVLEVGAFTIGGILIGWFGEVPLGANQIVLMLTATTYLMSSGLSSAATIRVSHFAGAKEWLHVKDAAVSILFMGVSFMMLCFLFFIVFKDVLPLVFTQNVEVIALASQLLLIAGLFQVFDGTQVVMHGILRGIEDVKIPMYLTAVAFYVIALPIGILLAFTFEMQTIGMWIGYLVGLAFISTTLIFRFRHSYLKLKKSNIQL